MLGCVKLEKLNKITINIFLKPIFILLADRDIYFAIENNSIPLYH